MTDHEPLPPREHEDLKADRPRGWPGRFAASPFWRIAGAGFVAAAAAALALLVWVVPSSDDGAETGPEDLTAAEVFAGIEDAASRDGQMLHTFVESYMGGELTTSSEYWVDAETGSVRRHTVPVNPTDTGDGIPTETTEIITGNYTYFEEGPGDIKRFQATQCEGLGAWLSAFLACSAGDPVALASASHSDWEGKPATVLTLEQDLSMGSEGTADPAPSLAYRLFYRLFVDRDDDLPLAVEWEVAADNGASAQVVMKSTFSHEFIERTPENLALVDPNAFGYGVESTEPLSTLAASMPVYWLGEEYNAGEQAVSIVLYLAEPEPGYGSALSLRYKTPSGSDALSVDIWHPGAWDASEAREPLHDSACVSVSGEELGGYMLTAYQMPQVNYPLPSPGESAEGDCLLETRSYGGMGDSGLLLTWEDENVVVVIKATDTGFFRNDDLLRATVAAAFQPYEPD